MFALFFAYVFSLAASARELPPEPFPNAQLTHQAEAGTWELTPQIMLGSENRAVGGDNSLNERYTSSALGVGGEYALNQMIAFHAALGLKRVRSTVSNCSSNCPVEETGSGMTDPTLAVKFKTPIGPGTLKATGVLDLSLGNHTNDQVAGHYNFMNGGDTLYLTLAYELPLGASKNNLLGVRIFQDVWNQDRKIDLTTASGVSHSETDSEAANTGVQAYYEYKLSPVTLGGFLRYDRTASSYRSVDGAAKVSNNQAYDRGMLGIYVPVLLGGSVTLFPEIDFVHYSHSGSPVLTDEVVNLSCYARFVF